MAGIDYDRLAAELTVETGSVVRATDIRPAIDLVEMQFHHHEIDDRTRRCRLCGVSVRDLEASRGRFISCIDPDVRRRLTFTQFVEQK